MINYHPFYQFCLLAATLIVHLQPTDQLTEDEMSEYETESEQSYVIGKDPTSTWSAMDFLNYGHPFIRQTVIDKVHGCIIGSALGDTIGLYTEFLSKKTSESFYKDRKFSLVEPVTQCYSDPHRSRFARCAWTDDTDQALLILLSYLSSQDLTTLPKDFALRLRIWIRDGLLALGRPAQGIGALVGSVVREKNYLRDPKTVATEKWIESNRFNAPNGSLMRTHPIGVIGIGMSEEEAWELATAVGGTTHVDPRCTVSCCIEVSVIRGILRGEIRDEEGLNEAIEQAYDWVIKKPELMNPGLDPKLSEREIANLLDPKEFNRHAYAKTLEELDLDGAGIGYVYKCLGSAILTLRLGMRATLHQTLPPKELFENLITDLIMEAGDADTNAAAAGALLGAWLGYSNLPPHWAMGLAHKEWLASKITRLTKAVGIVRGPISVAGGIVSETLTPESDETPYAGKSIKRKRQAHDDLSSASSKQQTRRVYG